MTYSVEQLTQDDWQIFRDIRLEALRLEPASFGSNYQKESTYGIQEWQDFIDKTANRAMFVLKDDNDVIGLTGVIRDRNNRGTGALIASYIKKEHRGQGLSKLLYQARLAWAKEQGCTAVVVSHRESNLASKNANQKFGFAFTHMTERLWHDGKTENDMHYKIDL